MKLNKFFFIKLKNIIKLVNFKTVTKKNIYKIMLFNYKHT